MHYKYNIIPLILSRNFLIAIGFISTIFSLALLSEQAVVDVLAKKNCDRSDANLIIGTRTTTIGTKCNDIVVGCPFSPLNAGPGGCNTGNLLRGLENDDVVQGSEGNDVIYGDDGDDKLTGGGGNDRLFGGPDNDILKVNVGSNLLVGGKGDDELYGGLGSDLLVGGNGADTFDCGENFDVIIDFNLNDGDVQNNNCEVIENYNDDMKVFAQPSKIKSHLEKFGVGTSPDKIDVDDIGKEID